MIQYIYKVLQTSWGIYINLTGTYRQYDGEGAHRISDRVYVLISDKKYPETMGFHQEALQNLLMALGKVAAQIEEHSEFEQTLLVIDTLLYNYCDYQEEGMIPAALGWAGKAFGFEVPEIPVYYNKTLKRYEFDFSSINE